MVGVPYSDEMVESALADFRAQVDPLGDSAGLEERYGEATFGTPVNVRNFDGRPELTEMDALIAYIQVLGTMVDFSTYTPVANR
jgi:cytochrome c oxidase cbb3-type subunit II